MKIVLSAVCSLLPALLLAADRPANVLTDDDRDNGWKLLFDGKSLAGWRATGKPDAFAVKDGAIVVSGPESYLYYDGPVGNHDFKNFELDMEVKTAPRAISGVFFHTEPVDNGAPGKGYKVQVNNKGNDPNRTGSLTGIKEYTDASANDGEWFRLNVLVEGKHVTTMVDGETIVDYTEEASPQRAGDLAQRLIGHGTIAFQTGGASQVQYRTIKLREL
jgi:hypothetical protein